ncbi:MAG: TlpA family protein disulfide reductase [Christensenellaceae bacterium]|nr:TlpA family protein disulfide reductase [Christensenellaceae bacterium]
MKIKRLMALLSAIMLFALPVLAENTTTETTEEIENLFMQIDTVTLSGEKFDMKTLEGKPLLINIWADWCPPCRHEMPILTKLSEEYADKIAFLGLLPEGVSVEEGKIVINEDRLKAGLEAQEEIGIGFTTLVPEELLYSLMAHTGLQAFPTTWFVSADGYLVDIVVGAMDEEGWRTKIDEVLKNLEEENGEG